MGVSKEELTALIAELVAIDSTNPDLVTGGAGEAEIARFVAGWLERAGLETEVHELGPSRANVVAVARGRGGNGCKTLMLNAHMDVVGAGGMIDPWTPRIESSRLYGRGAYDMKASLAAIMVAGREALRHDLRGDVIVTAVADEEFASIGVQDVVRRDARFLDAAFDDAEKFAFVFEDDSGGRKFADARNLREIIVHFKRNADKSYV